VMQLAQRLQREGVTCPNGCKIPSPRVRFLGLYDPVDMATGYGDGECIPANVDTSVRFLAARSPADETRGVFRADPLRSRLPISERSRGKFNRADGTSSARWHVDIWVFATHSGIGGAPWCGDHPLGHDERNDTLKSIRCDQFMRRAASNCGVPVCRKSFPEYGFKVPSPSLP
jgi:hypothetical protein